MKKGQFLLVALCASAMVLGGCGNSSSKKKTSSSSSSAQPTTSSEPTSSSSSSEAPVVVNVESVSLDPSSLAKNVGDKEVKLKATVLPENATNKNVTWSSSDPSVADVENGFVSFLKAGSATITVTTVDGSKTATCTVTVSQPWSAADLQIFEDHIYGVNVPYYAVEGAEVSYDSEGDVVFYKTPDSVEEPNCTPEILDAYADLFPEEWGLEPQISEEDGEEEYYYSGQLELVVTIEDKQTLRYVYVELGAYDALGDSSTDGNGYFYMKLFDPYYYSWAQVSPELEAIVNDLYSVESSLIPSYTGELFNIELDLQYYSESALFVYVFDVVKEEYQSYESGLKSNVNWVYDGIDAEYGWTEFHRADSSFALLLRFTEYTKDPGYGMIEFLLMPYIPSSTGSEWPEKPISDFINGGEAKTEIVLPAFDGGEDAVYEFQDASEYYGYAELSISGGANCTAEKVADYASGLVSNPNIISKEPTVSPAQTVYNFESKDHVFEFIATFVADDEDTAEDDSYVYFRIYRNNPLVDFPSAAIVEYLASLGAEAASFENVSGASEDIYYEMSASTYGVTVFVMNVTPAEISTYLGGLTGWSLNPNTDKYDHESGKAKIVVYDYSAEGYMSLYFTSKSIAWTEAEITAFEEALHGIVPVFTDAGLDYDYTKDGVFYSLDMSEAEVANYGAALVEPEAGWTYIEHVNGNPTYYKASEDGEGYAVMSFHINGDKYYFYLRFSADQPVADPTAWTEEQLAALDFETRLHGLVPPFVYANLSWSDEYSQYGASVNQAIGMNYNEYLSTPANGWTEISGGFAKEVSDASGYVVIELDDTYLDYYGVYLIYIYYVAYSE